MLYVWACLTSITTPLSGGFTLPQIRHPSAADRNPALRTFLCRCLRCQQCVICKWNRGLHKTDLSSVYQAGHEPRTMPHTGGSQSKPRHSSTRQKWNISCCLFPTPAVLNLYHSILPRDKIRTFPAVCFISQESVGGTAFTSRDFIWIRVESRGSGVPLPAGALAPIISAKLRPTQPVHAMGHWDYFPDGKPAEA